MCGVPLEVDVQAGTDSRIRRGAAIELAGIARDFVRGREAHRVGEALGPRITVEHLAVDRIVCRYHALDGDRVLAKPRDVGCAVSGAVLGVRDGGSYRRV